jgi:hypothetical protein
LIEVGAPALHFRKIAVEADISLDVALGDGEVVVGLLLVRVAVVEAVVEVPGLAG